MSTFSVGEKISTSTCRMSKLFPTLTKMLRPSIGSSISSTRTFARCTSRQGKIFNKNFGFKRLTDVVVLDMVASRTLISSSWFLEKKQKMPIRGENLSTSTRSWNKDDQSDSEVSKQPPRGPETATSFANRWKRRSLSPTTRLMAMLPPEALESEESDNKKDDSGTDKKSSETKPDTDNK